MSLYTTFTPRLVVDDAAVATKFYRAVLGATERMCLRGPDGRVLHLELECAGLVFSLTEASADDPSPLSLGGSPVILMLMDDDPDGVFRRAEAAGARIIHPVEDRPYGMRDGRFADPAGHVWIVTRVAEHLDPAELQRRLG
ncbi:MAG: VOC family protein [Myxococcota bacterium]